MDADNQLAAVSFVRESFAVLFNKLRWDETHTMTEQEELQGLNAQQMKT